MGRSGYGVCSKTHTRSTLSARRRDRAFAAAGRVRRFAKGAYLWQPDDAADRIYCALVKSEAEQRLGRLLLRLAASRGRKGSLGLKDVVTVSVSHNELAQLAGMSRPHVSVTMGRLRRRKLVQYEREGVVRVELASLTDYLSRIVRGERA